MTGETLILDAVKQNLESLAEKIETVLSDAGCPMPIIQKVLISVDEIFNNICSYAYSDGEKGQICTILQVSPEDKKASLTFKDKGIPYNPLEHKDPDTTLPAEKRPIGGLGILLVKKLMDEVSYEHTGEENSLTIVKGW